MSNLFNKIDSIDLTSILTEDADAIQKELDLEFSGKWEDNTKLTESELQMEGILKEVSDTLAIMNVSLNDLDKDEVIKIVEESLDRVEPRWSKALRESVLNKLGFTVRAKGIRKDLKESDESIESIQREISDLKAGIEGLDKSGQTEFEYNNQTYSKTSAGSRISSLESKLDTMNKDNNKNRENGFGEETIAEDNSIKESRSTLKEEESVKNIISDLINILTDEGSIDASILTDKLNTVLQYLDDETDTDLIQRIRNLINIVDDEGSIDSEKAIDELSYINSHLNESVAANVTVDNIDQESKDKATIDKAIEIAGDKDTINNDTFRELRLQLANKDYDLVDRSKDYALVRGEDVIYTWLRAEDINESVHVNISGSNIDVSTDNTNVAVDGDNVDVHVDENTAEVEIPEPVTDEILPDPETTVDPEPSIDNDVNAEEILDEPANEEILDTTNSEDELLDDSEELKEAAEDILNKANISKDDFDKALSDQFPDFEFYTLDSEANRFDLVSNGQITSYVIDLTDNSINIRPEGENISDENVITLINLNTNESESLDEEGMQVNDVPSKVDQKKRIELAKLESEDFETVADKILAYYDGDVNKVCNKMGMNYETEFGEIDRLNKWLNTMSQSELDSYFKSALEESNITYRISYLNENDEEIAGWDIDADNDEDAIASLDKFNNADEITDDLLTAEFVETGIEGISSLNYKNTNILLSTDGEENTITINQDGQDPIVFKGESFDDVLNKLIYWFIMNSETSDEEPEEIISDKKESENE